jgi:hypothetical protein
VKNLLLLTLLGSTITANAQDTIYHLHTEPLLVKLEEVNPGRIKYKHWDYQNGPSYIIARRDIVKVVSADGKVLWVNEKAWERQNKEQAHITIAKSPGIRRVYHRNILVASPICVLANGFGFAASYERVDKKGWTGLRIVAAGTLDNPAQYIMPGIRIYPFGQRIATFFVTPSLFFGNGSHPYSADSIDVYGKSRSYMARKDAFQAGFFTDIGLNIHLLPNTIGMVCLGGGINYAAIGSTEMKDYAAFAKFEVGFGYRFK